MLYTGILLFGLLAYVSCLKETTKFCVNCKYYLENIDNPTMSKCKKFTKISEDFMVTGKEGNLGSNYYFCSTARKIKNMCGTDATCYVKNNRRKRMKKIDLNIN